MKRTLSTFLAALAVMLFGAVPAFAAVPPIPPGPPLTASTTVPNPEAATATTPFASSVVAPLAGGKFFAPQLAPRGVRTLAQFHTTADMVSVPSGFSNAAPPTGLDPMYPVATEVRYSGTGNFTIASAATGVLSTPVDLADMNLSWTMRAGPNTQTNGRSCRINLASTGAPNSLPANYVQVELFYENGILKAQNSTDNGLVNHYEIPGPEVIYQASQGFPALQGVVQVGTGANLNAITFAWITCPTASAGATVQFSIGDVRATPIGLNMALIVLSADDINVAQRRAFEEMIKRGIPGTIYPGAGISDVGRANRFSDAELRMLQENGFQIAMQGPTTEDYPTVQAMGDTGRVSDIGKWRNAADAWGFSGGWDCSYYSGFGPGATGATSVSQTYYRNCATIRAYGSASPVGQPPIHFGVSAPPADPYMIRAIELAGSRFNVVNGYSTQLKQAVDQTIRNRGGLFLAFHDQLIPANANSWQTFLDLLDDPRRGIDFEFVTMREFYERLYAQPISANDDFGIMPNLAANDNAAEVAFEAAA